MVAEIDEDMAASGSSPSSPLLGYLTFVEIPSHGMVGGYLLVNERARPVEFHCTAPVQASRTQEILYGRTFRAALISDQIGQALISQSALQPALLLTDEVDAMALRTEIATPLALFVETTDGPREVDVDWSFEHAGRSVTTAPGFESDRPILRDVICSVGSNWDLMEPLARIRAAIREAQRAAA